LYHINKTNDMILLEIEDLDLDNNTLTAVFDGLFGGGFTVKTDFGYDKEETEAEEETNTQYHIEPTNIWFDEFKTFNSEEEEFSINDRELKKIKELVEFKLIDLLTEELND